MFFWVYILTKNSMINYRSRLSLNLKNTHVQTLIRVVDEFLEVGAFDALVAAMRHPDSSNDAQLQCWGAGAISMSLGFKTKTKQPAVFCVGCCIFFVWLLWQ